MTKVLVIRRDNIGDLVCTTPLFSALRAAWPTARIVALVNSYNAPVLHGNPDIDEVCIYRKAKHRAQGESLLAVWWQTWRLLQRLRREHFDIAIIATPGRQPAALKFARWIKADRIVSYGTETDGITDPVPLSLANAGHEVECVMRLLEPLGISSPAGPVRVYAPHPTSASTTACDGPLIGLHISARKPPQRWPVERFAELARRLHATHGARFLLFWAPGPKQHPQHPGDDESAARLLADCRGLPVEPYATQRLEELIAGLARCDHVICSDGGAMHLAAGLGKPIVCFFGNSGATHWRPWGVPHELLQPESMNVGDLAVDTVAAAYERLLVAATGKVAG